jgi:hypothetical protein
MDPRGLRPPGFFNLGEKMAKKQEEMKAQAGEEIVKSQDVDMRALEKAALAKVLKKLGISESELDELERIKADNEDELDYDLGGQVVHVNGEAYSRGRAKRGLVETILSMAANKKDRLLNEMIGKKGMANLMHGVIRADIPVTEREDAMGTKVNQ